MKKKKNQWGGGGGYGGSGWLIDKEAGGLFFKMLTVLSNCVFSNGKFGLLSPGKGSYDSHAH